MILFLFFINFAHAIEVLPVEIIEAPMPNVFSDRADVWPTEKVYTDYTISDQSLYDNITKFSTIGSRGDLSGGSPNFSIRGSGESARTLLLYDGIPLNLLDGSGPSPLLLPQETTHSIFALKGPSSVLYGSDAIGGAINIAPYSYTRPVVRGGIGSFGRKSIYGAFPILKNEDHKLQVTGFSNSIDGNFPYEANGVELERDPNNSHLQRFTLGGVHKISSITVKETVIYGQSFGATSGPINAQSNTYYNRTGLLGSVTVEKNISSKDSVALRSTGIFTESFNRDPTITRWYASQIAESASYKKTFSSQASGEFFLDYFYDEFENKPAVGRLTDNRFEPGFILNYAPDQSYYISPGIRYLPDIGLVIKSIIVGQDFLNTKTWLSYSEGFRNPSFTQKYYQSVFFVGNPNLKPEKSDQIEIGFSKKNSLNSSALFERLAFDMSVYSTKYYDFIEYVGLSAQNSGEVNLMGVDVSTGINYEIFSAQISYSYLDPDVELTLMPKHKWSFILGAQLGPIVAEAVQTHWDKYLLTQTSETGSWDVFDLNVRTVGLSDWTIKASVQNIFDNKRSFTQFYPEPGRQFLASVERSF